MAAIPTTAQDAPATTLDAVFGKFDKGLLAELAEGVKGHLSPSDSHGVLPDTDHMLLSKNSTEPPVPQPAPNQIEKA